MNPQRWSQIATTCRYVSMKLPKANDSIILNVRE